MFGSRETVAGTARLEGLGLEVGWCKDQRLEEARNKIGPPNLLCNHRVV